MMLDRPRRSCPSCFHCCCCCCCRYWFESGSARGEHDVELMQVESVGVERTLEFKQLEEQEGVNCCSGL